MNVLLLDQFSDLGGAQFALLDTLAAIAAQGWSATVGLPGDGPLLARVKDLGFEPVRIECGPYGSGRKSAGDMLRFAVEAPRLAARIRELSAGVRADLIYANGPRVVPAVALASGSTPVLFHSHSYLPPGPVRKATAFALRHARAHVVAASRYVAEQWRESAGERLSVIYNGIAAPPAPVREASEQWRVGFIGRIAREKGLREFVEVARRVCAERPDARFIVYGAALFSGSEYEQEVRGAANGVPIEFAGWTEDVWQALGRLDLLLVPSLAHEAVTRVIPEAFAAGVPVIAFASGGIPEVVDHGVNGLLVKSVEDMAAAALSMRPGQFVEAARANWSERFTVERYQREIVGQMTRTAGGDRPGYKALLRRQ